MHRPGAEPQSAGAFRVGKVIRVAPVIGGVLVARHYRSELLDQGMPVTAGWTKHKNIVALTLQADAKPERLDRAMLAEVGNRCRLVAAVARAAVMQ